MYQALFFFPSRAKEAKKKKEKKDAWSQVRDTTACCDQCMVKSGITGDKKNMQASFHFRK